MREWLTRLVLLTCLQLMAAAHAHMHTAAPERPLRLAVLGDSDSHGYQDSLAFPPGSPARGGAWRASTLQWTEIIDRLRPRHLDLGPRELTGHNLPGAGLLARAPRKLDHRHNFAVSGARCEDLNGGRWHESRHLTRLLREDPAGWNGGIVVIRIGINDVGTEEPLSRLAVDPLDPVALRAIDSCTAAIAQAVQVLHQTQPTLRVVVVGIFNNAHWGRFFDRWHDPRELAHIEQGMDRFDAALRRLARPGGPVAFFDDRQLFREAFGDRRPDGRPDYRTFTVAPGLHLRNGLGDEPHHMSVADGHTGTLWNAIWVNRLFDVIEREFGVAVPRLTPAEIGSLVPAHKGS